MNKEYTIGISVEGQTEAYFVKYVLARYLKNYGINLANPLILGGNVNLARIENILSLMSSQYDYITTLYDFYGFEGKDNSDNYSSLCNKIKNQGVLKNKNNIIPYVQMYEFEAILFSDLAVLCKYMDDDSQKIHQYKILFEENLKNKQPEEVNDSIETAPSKRIHRIFRKYKKSIYGYIVAQEIGISKIRAKCPNFNNWIEQLIKLTQQ